MNSRSSYVITSHGISKRGSSQAGMPQIEETITHEDSSDQDDDGEIGLGDDGEIGLLDLMEQFEDESLPLKESTNRIANITNEIGEKISGRTAEIDEFSAGPNAHEP